jgi:hypothetical protein
VLLGDYLAWLQERSLQDAERLLDLAAAALQRNDSPAPLASALWLDGFAEMTPPELDLLAAAAARCQQATLAFCLEAPPAPTPGSWLSIWTGIGETFRQCHARFATRSHPRPICRQSRVASSRGKMDPAGGFSR